MTLKNNWRLKVVIKVKYFLARLSSIFLSKELYYFKVDLLIIVH